MVFSGERGVGFAWLSLREDKGSWLHDDGLHGLGVEARRAAVVSDVELCLCFSDIGLLCGFRWSDSSLSICGSNLLCSTRFIVGLVHCLSRF